MKLAGVPFQSYITTSHLQYSTVSYSPSSLSYKKITSTHLHSLHNTQGAHLYILHIHNLHKIAYILHTKNHVYIKGHIFTYVTQRFLRLWQEIFVLYGIMAGDF